MNDQSQKSTEAVEDLDVTAREGAEVKGGLNFTKITYNSLTSGESAQKGYHLENAWPAKSSG